MSVRRMLIISLLISLWGHLIIFTTFSVAIPREEKRVSEFTHISFLGELVKKKIPPRVETVVRENISQLQPLFRKIGVGPDLSLSKPLPTVPTPQISLEEILFFFLGQEEAAFLQMKITEERKEVPPKKLHLLEKEQDE